MPLRAFFRLENAMLFDTHCHLDMLTPVKESGRIDDIVREADEAGVTRMVCVAVELEQVSGILKLIESFDHIHASAGVHPSHQVLHEPSAADILAVADHPRIVAIGETGLDYHYDAVPRDVQRQRFREHVRAAVECGKPLIVHTREAREDTLAILREEGAEHCGGVLHCFTESWEVAEAALEIGFHISLSGIVTFRNAEELREVARRVPRERLLIETDAPYLAPVPMRGKENHPAWVKHVAECIARERGESFDELARYTRENGERLFRLN